MNKSNDCCYESNECKVLSSMQKTKQNRNASTISTLKDRDMRTCENSLAHVSISFIRLKRMIRKKDTSTTAAMRAKESEQKNKP